MMPMGSAWQPTGDLSLRFPTIGRSELTFSNVLGPSDALALRLCSQIVQGRVRIHPPPGNFMEFELVAGTI